MKYRYYVVSDNRAHGGRDFGEELTNELAAGAELVECSITVGPNGRLVHSALLRVQTHDLGPLPRALELELTPDQRLKSLARPTAKEA